MLFLVLNPKVLGIAIARYDFCARDMRELSPFKDDVVKIYTKTGTNGWWRGESNGKVMCKKVFNVSFNCLNMKLKLK